MGVGAALGASGLRAAIIAADFIIPTYSGPQESDMSVLPNGRLGCFADTCHEDSPFRTMLDQCYHSQLCGPSLCAPCQHMCVAFQNLF